MANIYGILIINVTKDKTANFHLMSKCYYNRCFVFSIIL